MAPHKHSES
jgi:hypothetical protein